MSEVATLGVDGRIATLTLNRPDKRNALSQDLIEALQAHVDALGARDDVSVLVLTGAGKSFCAGMDLRAVLGNTEAPKRMLGALAELTISIRSLPCAVLARVTGAAIGGGCGLVAVSDLSITHPDAKLGYPEVDLGVCPAVVAPWLVHSIGAGAARRILLQGGTMTGQRAHHLGLVTECVPIEDIDARVEELAQHLAAAGPLALRATKQQLNDLDGDVASQVRQGAELSATVFNSPDAQQRLSAIYGR
jgi:methylglutaconyl-CoA hydratase